MFCRAITGMRVLMGIVEGVCSVWNAMEIVHGKSRHSEIDSSVKNTNVDIQGMLRSF